ncbi:hypothetical protein AAZX31_01G006900 [Glycine max]
MSQEGHYKASYLPNKHSSSPDPSTLEDLIILKDVYMSKIYLKKKGSFWLNSMRPTKRSESAPPK